VHTNEPNVTYGDLLRVEATPTELRDGPVDDSFTVRVSHPARIARNGEYPECSRVRSLDLTTVTARAVADVGGEGDESRRCADDTTRHSPGIRRSLRLMTAGRCALSDESARKGGLH